jgi:hypothetical protein
MPTTPTRNFWCAAVMKRRCQRTGNTLNTTASARISTRED